MDLFRRVPVGNGWRHGRHAWVNPIVTADAPKPRPIQGLISAWSVAFSLHSCAAPCDVLGSVLVVRPTSVRAARGLFRVLGG